MTRLAVLSAALFLSACATTPEPKIVYREVKVPVVVACPENELPPKPPSEISKIDVNKDDRKKKLAAIIADLESSEVEALNLRSLIRACGG